MEDGGHACDSYSLREATFLFSPEKEEEEETMNKNMDEKILSKMNFLRNSPYEAFIE